MTALYTLCAASFMGPFMGSAFNLALPRIAEAFSFKAVGLTWFPMAFMLSTAVCQVPFARLGDMFGRKRVFLIGLLGMSLTIMVCPLAPSSRVLIILRFLSGVFSAMMFSGSVAMVVSVVTPEMRAKALALNTASVYSALALGPALGGFLIQYWGWESIFYLAAALTALIFILSLLCIKGEWTEARGARFDYLGSLIFAAALLGIIYGFTNLPRIHGLFSIAGGGAALVLFVVFEKKSASPLLDMSLFFSNRTFSLACLAALINYAASASVAFIMSLYLQYVKGFSAGAAGMLLIIQALLQVLAALSAGRLSARVPPARLAAAGMSLCALGLLGLCRIGPDAPLGWLLFCLAALGCGFGLFSSPNTNVIMSSVEKRHYGQASATTGTVRLTGQAVSMGLAAMCIALFAGDREIRPEIYPDLLAGFRLTFIIFTGLCLAGVYASRAGRTAR
ncbi:MAG: MFS transporter [Deltaproteobacteria bacterium]|jgi:MFS family permease|nr:MFS transporter [Deltaproteobacteria bacterium]